MSLLLASNAWIIDVVFFAILLIAFIIGIIRGFVRGVIKLAGTFLAVIVAFFFCMPLTGWLDDRFGLVTMLAGSIGSAGAAYWIIVAVSFVALIILTKLGAFLLGLIGKSIVRVSRLLNSIDKVLGAILSVAEALLLICLVMAICKWIQIDVVEEFLAQSHVVGPMYFGGWFEWLATLPGRFIEGGKQAVSLLGAIL